VIIVLLDVLANEPIDGVGLTTALVGGVALGVAVPLVVGLALRVVPGSSTDRYEALAPVAIGLLVFALAEITGANSFLAAFAAGMTVASVSPRLRQAFEQFGELVSELLKLGAILLLGALLTSAVFVGSGVAGIAFVVIVLTIGRALPVVIALLGSGVRGKELLTVAWFGPKGFSSVVYGLLILSAGVADGRQMAELVALTVVTSIVVHSSTDVAVAGWFSAPDSIEPQ
jgi:NhaP-type Na+/H+ or K+/H+ antiporter